MNLNLTNPGPILTADLNVLGAAVKILLAGGSRLSEAEARRASGASPYLWRMKGDAISELVLALEGAQCGNLE